MNVHHKNYGPITIILLLVTVHYKSNLPFLVGSQLPVNVAIYMTAIVPAIAGAAVLMVLIATVLISVLIVLRRKPVTGMLMCN